MITFEKFNNSEMELIKMGEKIGIFKPNNVDIPDQTDPKKEISSIEAKDQIIPANDLLNFELDNSHEAQLSFENETALDLSVEIEINEPEELNITENPEADLGIKEADLGIKIEDELTEAEKKEPEEIEIFENDNKLEEIEIRETKVSEIEVTELSNIDEMLNEIAESEEILNELNEQEQYEIHPSSATFFSSLIGPPIKEYSDLD